MELGVCYYPEHWPEEEWQRDAERMVDLGLRKVRIGEFAWSRLEPVEGDYQFEWLRRAIDVLHSHGLQVVLATPTACPPKWLIDKHPEILAKDENGQTRGFGSRRHYCFSSRVFKHYCKKIVTDLAKTFGNHPAIIAWQIDNEFGCHDSIISYSDDAAVAFREWCRDKYNGIDSLNQVWGNVFWSTEYNSFDAIDPPWYAVTEINPAHRLAYWRFHTNQVRRFNQLQTEILRKLSPGRDLIHNFMGNFVDFDHHEVGKDLDIASWDSYPLGFLERSSASKQHKKKYLRTGDPDFTAFHHDLYRNICSGRWWVMEQQPGPVNWAPHNPAPMDGMVRFWTLEAFAHGAEVVSYFRYRQCPFGQEQMHAGLYLPDGSSSRAVDEVQQIVEEICLLNDVELAEQAPVALVFDYASDAALRIQPQGSPIDPLDEVLRWYKTLRLNRCDIDVVGTGADLSGYDCVIVPSVEIIEEDFLDSLSALEVPVIFGPRSASKTPELSIPEGLAPGNLQSLIPLRIEYVESLNPVEQIPLEDRQSGKAQGWRERVTTQLVPQCTSEDGWGVLYRQENYFYLAATLDDEGLDDVIRSVLDAAGISSFAISGGLRFRSRGQYRFAFNYGPEAEILEHTGPYVIGHNKLDPGRLAVWLKQ